MRSIITLSLLMLTLKSFGQFPFEKYPAPHYQTYKGWKAYGKPDKGNQTQFFLSISKFFNKKDSLTLLLTSFDDKWDSSYITILRNGKSLQRFFEPMFFNDVNLSESVMVADINGDKLQDLKLIIPYMDNGLGWNTRVIYLFQLKNKSFLKISYLDNMAGENRQERDFDGDGNYEIITMTLVSYLSHSYLSFNLFNYKNNDFINVNNKQNYPILIQFLYKDNFKVTHIMSRQKMKEFEQTKPKEYNKK